MTELSERLAQVPLEMRMKEVSRQLRPRKISAQSGRALEILGHAIDYLADEYSYNNSALDPNAPEIQAMQLLMLLNRQIYLACPITLTVGERCYNFFRNRKQAC